MKVLENFSFNGKLTSGMSERFVVMPSRFAIYIPSVNHRGKIPEAMVEHALKVCRNKMRELAGGTSQHLILGTYTSSSGIEVKEDIIKVYVRFIEIDSIIQDVLFKLCEWLKQYLQQERIAAELNSDFLLI